MRARHTIETARWQVVDVAPLLAQIKAEPNRTTERITGSTLLAAAMSAARLGNAAAAEQASGGLRDLAAAMKARKAFETRQVEIMTGTLESFHVPDAMGWDLQIGNKIAPTPRS